MDDQNEHVRSEPMLTNGRLPTAIRYVRIGYALLASIFAACIMIQVFLAGLAVFVDPGNWGLHSSFVRFFTYLPFIMLVLVFVGRMPRGMRWLNLMLFGMLIVQYLTVVFSPEIGVLAAFHPVIALMLFAASMNNARQSWKYL